jgi:dephospho-CoA kinase
LGYVRIEMHVVLIAVTGGIASGKSVVARRLADHGAVHVDADVLAREVVEPGTPALKQIAAHFGPSVINTDGTLNRAALGTIIFSDDDGRKVLGEITHPAVWARAQQLFDAAVSADADAIVVYDVPLLVEAGGQRPMSFDRIVVVDAPAETRIQRLIELRGMNRDDAEARVRSQASDAERRAVADDIIFSGGTLTETLSQVDALWSKLRPDH